MTDTVPDVAPIGPVRTRGTVLNDDVARLYMGAIVAGANREEAATLAGISPRTVEVWRRRLREAYGGDIDRALEDDTPDEDGHLPTIADLIAFFRGVERADAAMVVDRLNRIRRAGESGTWQADAWYLERRYPDRFGRRQRVEHAGAPDAPVRVRITFDGVEDRAEPIDVEATEVEPEAIGDGPGD